MSQTSDARLELTTIRGIACMALVAYHVIGPSSESGMHLPDASNWHYAVHSFDFLRMPLFSVLSGYFYARHRVSAATLSSFLAKKGVRLGLPLLFVTAVMLQLRWFAYGDTTSFFHAALFHYQHLWFLQALIVIFVAVTLSDSFARLDTVGLCVTGFAAVMVSRSFAVTSFFSLNGAFYLAPFFLFGMILREERTLLESPKSLRAALWLVGVVMLVQQAGALGEANPLDGTSLAAVLCGCSAAYALLVLCPRITSVEKIGTYSYTIYLWHSIAAAAVRPLVERHLGLTTGAEFLVLFGIGIAVPIGIHLIVERIPLISILVAGISHIGRAPRLSDTWSNLVHSSCNARGSSRFVGAVRVPLARERNELCLPHSG
jgi:peptidoglycan/LPS O-acetylase OafA/YrhL